MTSRHHAKIERDLYNDLKSLTSSYGYAKVQVALDAIQAMDEEDEGGATLLRTSINMSCQRNAARPSKSRLQLIELGSRLTNYVVYGNKYRSRNTFCLNLTSLHDSDFEDENGFFEHCMMVLENYFETLCRIWKPFVIEGKLQTHHKTKKLPGSICDTLDLEYNGSSQSTQAIISILRHFKVISLFSNLIIRGGATTGVLPRLDGAIIDRLRALPQDTDVTSISIRDCALGAGDIFGLAQTHGMKKINLHNVTISKVRHQVCYRGNDGEYDVCDLSITLTEKLTTDEDQVDCWLDVLDDIQRVTHLTVHYPGNDSSLQEMTDCLSTLAVKNLYLKFDSIPVDADVIREICEAASNSSHLSMFHVGARRWPADLARQIPPLMLQLAMLPSMGLMTLKMSLPFECWAVLDLDPVRHVDEITGLAKVSTLRRFLSEGIEQVSLSLDCLETRLDLVTNYLPLVYDVGIPEVKNFRGDERTRCLRGQLAVQLERNYVGLALCYPNIFPTIPLGLWPMVLSNAMDRRAAVKKRNGKLPLTGVFEMVRKLAERDVITSLNSKC